MKHTPYSETNTHHIAHLFIWDWNRSFSIMSRKAWEKTVESWDKNFTERMTTKAWKNKIVIHNFDRFHTLCWAKIKTLCCPIAVEASGLDISDPIPHSWSISWRATSLGEWWSSWSSPPDPTPISFRRSTRWSGGFSPVTSKGWLHSFNR